MLRKTLMITAICATSIGMTGCSSIWTAASHFSSDMAEFTKFSWLRGSSTKSDISFAENVDPVTGVYKTEVGEYVPATTDYSNDYTSDYTDVASSVVDSSPHPCPEGTYYAEDKTCMSLETEEYDFPDMVTETVAVDTSPIPCPEDTYLNAKNECMYLETETFDFADDVNMVDQVIDTSPIPCPEGTYLNAENTCMYLETEEFDFAQDTPSVLPGADFTPDFAMNAPNLNGPIECPPGFTLNGTNSCMYVGMGLQTGN